MIKINANILHLVFELCSLNKLSLAPAMRCHDGIQWERWSKMQHNTWLIMMDLCCRVRQSHSWNAVFHGLFSLMRASALWCETERCSAVTLTRSICMPKSQPVHIIAWSLCSYSDCFVCLAFHSFLSFAITMLFPYQFQSEKMFNCANNTEDSVKS